MARDLIESTRYANERARNLIGMTHELNGRVQNFIGRTRWLNEMARQATRRIGEPMERAWNLRGRTHKLNGRLPQVTEGLASLAERPSSSRAALTGSVTD